MGKREKEKKRRSRKVVGKIGWAIFFGKLDDGKERGKDWGEFIRGTTIATFATRLKSFLVRIRSIKLAWRNPRASMEQIFTPKCAPGERGPRAK